MPLKQITQTEVEAVDAIIVKDPEVSNRVKDTTPGSSEVENSSKNNAVLYYYKKGPLKEALFALFTCAERRTTLIQTTAEF